MWKAAVGHNVSVKVEAQGDDWDTDPDFVNDISEREQRWGAKSIAGSGRAEHIDIHQLRNKVSEEHEVIKKKELETGPKASYGYGGKFGTERDQMDKCAMGHEYVADVGKHSSQTDAAQGFGGKFGVQRDRADKSALGFEYKGEVEKHSSQKGKPMGMHYSRGFGGRYGVERDKVDKAVVGFDYRSQAEKHDSQKDYSMGFGGKFGVQRDRQDKSALGWDHQEEVQPHASQTGRAMLQGRQRRFLGEHTDLALAVHPCGDSAAENRVRHLGYWECSVGCLPSLLPALSVPCCPHAVVTPPCSPSTWLPVAFPALGAPRSPSHPPLPLAGGQRAPPREDEETPPSLPPRPADLGGELCKVLSQDQPIYSESLDIGGDYEELPEPSDYCDSTSGGADYEDLPAPVDAIYDQGGDGGEDY
ncbi:HCLS1 protein, partial [Pterocles burchelli]|nr:HCLS1 protein [Pterocles burchelli]